jgi:hypothetical protein
MQAPAQLKQSLLMGLLFKLTLNPGNQFLPLPVHLILGVEQRPPLLVALGFQGLDLLLTGKLLLQRQRSGGSTSGFLDLPVQFLDFPFQPDL